MREQKTRKSRKQIKQELREEAQVQEDGMSYEEISEILGISKREVMKIERAAMRKLKAPGELSRRLHALFQDLG